MLSIMLLFVLFEIVVCIHMFVLCCEITFVYSVLNHVVFGVFTISLFNIFDDLLDSVCRLNVSFISFDALLRFHT